MRSNKKVYRREEIKNKRNSTAKKILNLGKYLMK
jgi:hypothetical protein